MSKKVLIITYYWPPSGGAGVQRWLKFAKYLPEFDIEPIIITVNPEYAEYPAHDTDLEKDQENLKVIKTKTIEPFGFYKLLTGKKQVPFGSVNSESKSFKSKFTNWVRANLFIPDARFLWKYYAVSAANKVIKEEKIDFIITTSPPNSVHQIGYKLFKKHNIPWIMDLRDPWTNNKTAKLLPKNKLTKFIDKRIENKLFENCSQLIVVSEGMKQEYQKYAVKLSVLTNGFDAADYPTIQPEKSEQFVLTYNGNFKNSQNIDAFWASLKELINENNDFKEKLVLQFVGKITEQSLNSIAKYGLNSNVNLIPYVEHSKSIELLNKANLLYLPIPNAEGNEGILTGKIFEYLATGKPILGIGPINGNAAQVLQKLENAIMVDYEDKDAIKHKIITEFKKFLSQENSVSKIDLNEHPFNRKKITEDLAKIINQK